MIKFDSFDIIRFLICVLWVSSIHFPSQSKARRNDLLKEWHDLDQKIQEISKRETEILNKKLELELALNATIQSIKEIDQKLHMEKFVVIRQSHYLEKDQKSDLLRSLIESGNPGEAERKLKLLRFITYHYIQSIREHNKDLKKLETEEKLYSNRIAKMGQLQRELKVQVDGYMNQLSLKGKIINDLRNQLKNDTTLWKLKLENAINSQDSARISLYRSLLNKNFRDRKGQLTSPSDHEIKMSFGVSKFRSQSPSLPFQGLLFASPNGTSVRAMTDGIVEWIGHLSALGPTIIIDHGLGLRSIYGGVHGRKMQVGDAVKEGVVIGQVAAIHRLFPQGLYFEVREGVLPTDPLRWILTKTDFVTKDSNQWENVQ